MKGPVEPVHRSVPETIQEVIELTGFLCFLFRSTPNVTGAVQNEIVISNCSPLEIVDFKWVLNKKNQKRSCLANTILVARVWKKSSLWNLHNSGKYYQFTFRPKKIKAYRNLEIKCFFSIYMFNLQIVTTFQRSSKWNSAFGMWFYQKLPICPWDNKISNLAKWRCWKIF